MQKRFRMGFISAIIPAYNKELVLGEALEDIYTELKKTKIQFEMIVINDGSTDRTKKKIEEFCKNHKEGKMLNLVKKTGKGNAIRKGFEISRGDLIFFMDADADLSPNQIHLFLQYMNKYNADVVIGSKNHPDSIVEYPLMRKILSRCYQILCFVLFALPVSDTQVGLDLFKREVLEFAMPKMLVKKFAFTLELLTLANAKGFHIKEAPIEIRLDKGKFSSVNIVEIFNMLIDTVAIWYRLNILNYYKLK